VSLRREFQFSLNETKLSTEFAVLHLAQMKRKSASKEEDQDEIPKCS